MKIILLSHFKAFISNNRKINALSVNTVIEGDPSYTEQHVRIQAAWVFKP